MKAFYIKTPVGEYFAQKGGFTTKQHEAANYRSERPARYRASALAAGTAIVAEWPKFPLLPADAPSADAVHRILGPEKAEEFLSDIDAPSLSAGRIYRILDYFSEEGYYSHVFWAVSAVGFPAGTTPGEEDAARTWLNAANDWLALVEATGRFLASLYDRAP